jgi:hypothetical protein
VIRPSEKLFEPARMPRWLVAQLSHSLLSASDRFCASVTPIPPYFTFQSKVPSLIPCCPHNSTLFMPASPCFTIATIWFRESGPFHWSLFPRILPGNFHFIWFLSAGQRHKNEKTKREWARARRARLKSEQQNDAIRIAGLFGASPT